MRKVITTVCLFLFFLIFLFAGFTIHGRASRQTELENAVTSSLEKTMQMVKEADETAPITNEEMKVYFLQTLSAQINSKSRLTVNIKEADVAKGLLSVEGILTYVHPIGTIGNVTCEKTIILEQYMDTDGEKNMYKVQFFVDGNVFKVYELSEGSNYMNPGIPENKEGKRFAGWRGNLGAGSFEQLFTGEVVTESAVYTAEYVEQEDE